MTTAVPERHPLRELFREATRWAFRYTEFTDPRAAEEGLRAYLSEELLTRFLHVDQLYRLRDARGRALADVGEMLASGEARGVPRPLHALAVQRHIGDYTLFISGLFPENLARVSRDWRRKDAVMVQLGDLLVPFHDVGEYYEEAGRRAYRQAAELAHEAGLPEADRFALLSDFFPDYTKTLSLVRVYLDASPAFAEHRRIIV